MAQKSLRPLAVFFNSPTLGGAERSMLEQIKLLGELAAFSDITCFVPRLQKEEVGSSLKDALEEAGLKWRSFAYLPALFQVSRSQGVMFETLMNLPWLLGESILTLRRLNLSHDTLVWCNGNKVGLLWFFYKFFFGLPHRLIWHFRDYPAQSSLYRWLWSFLAIMKRGLSHFYLVANSYSVAQAVNRAFQGQQCVVLYNPAGAITKCKRSWQHGNLVIATASMLAPWKGVLEAVGELLQNAPRLKELGVCEIRIYGDNPYHTIGEHSHYAYKLQKLLEHHPQRDCIKLRLMGNHPPKEIFSDINILIHSSQRPEPFGRILVEAFHAEVAVVSTALGGAAELAQHEITAMCYDYKAENGLITVLESLLLQNEKRQTIVASASLRAINIEESARQALKKLLLLT